MHCTVRVQIFAGQLLRPLLMLQHALCVCLSVTIVVRIVLPGRCNSVALTHPKVLQAYPMGLDHYSTIYYVVVTRCVTRHPGMAILMIRGTVRQCRTVG